MRDFFHASHASMFGFLLSLVPLVVAAWFAIRPSERLLSIMRPLTLGAVFSALCSFVLDIANGCIAVSMMDSLDLRGVHFVGTVLSEGMGPVVASFACLSVAWFLVGIGMRKG